MIAPCLTLVTPRSERGQIEHSYGIDLQSGVAVRRSYNLSACSITWAIAELSADERAALESYSAAGGANFAPAVKAAWVVVEVILEVDRPTHTRVCRPLWLPRSRGRGRKTKAGDGQS